ncbi:MAG: ABC transporter permease [Saprospiraceae bacterium]|nr:ABC transporter permease [Saprospiraceae bacterium]
MSVILKKLSKDIGKTKGQAFLSLLAIIITVWGVSTVYYGYWMTERDFRVNFDQTQPAHMLLSLDTNQLKVMEKIADMPEVQAVERRESFMGRVKDEEGDWMPILLFAVEDFTQLKVNTFTLEGEDWPRIGDIAIERKSAGFLGTGKEVAVELPGQDTKVFPLVSYTHDPRLPSARMDRIVYGYLTLSTYRSLRPDRGQANYLLSVKDDAPSLSALVQLEQQIQAKVAGDGGTISIEILPLDEHPHQNVVDAVSVLQLGLGVILTILGITLLSLILLLWMLPQVREVALMKAIGAATKDIRKAYQALLLLAGLIGIIFGLPLGYLSGSFFSRFIAFTQNFDPVAGPLPLATHLPIALTCLCIPLFVGWRPIARAISTSSIQGLRNVFTGVPKKGLYALQWLFRSTQVRYSLNSFLRNGTRLALSLALLVLGLSLFFVGINLQYALDRDTDQYFAASSYQLSFRVHKLKQDQLLAIAAVDNVGKVWTIGQVQLYVEAELETNKKAVRLQHVPLDYTIDPAYWVEGGEDRSCEDCVWINQSMAHELGDPEIGQVLHVTDSRGQATALLLVGILKELAVGPAMYAYAKPGVELETSALWIALKDKQTESGGQTQAAIEAALGKHLLGSSNSGQKLEMLRAHLQPTFLIIKAIGGLTIGMGLLGLGLLININIQERQKEIGILKALGTGSAKISRLLLQEIVLLNGLGILLAIPVAYFISVEMGKLLGDTLLHIAIPFHADWGMMTLSIVLLLGFQWSVWFPYLRNRIRRSSIDLVRA